MYKVSFFTFIWFLFLCIPTISFGQDQMRYDDHIYRSNIKTVELHNTTWKFSPPIIQMHSGQKLFFDFDDLDGDYKSYYYTFIHCDANWQPSDINTYDYIKGLPQDFLTSYSYSFNTYQKYTHYWLQFPNRNTQFLISGNYILKIYLNNDPDSIIITRRFMIYEDLLGIHAREKQGIGEDLFTKQEIIFSINTVRYPVQDPFQSLHIFILQNGRWDNAVTGLQPQFVLDTCLQYFQDDGNSFDGGNQFRSFDMTSLRYNTEHIEGKIANLDAEEIQLKRDDARGNAPYFTTPDIDGQYEILDKDDDSSTINSQYVWVDFYLPMDTVTKGARIFIFGQLSDWQCKPEYEMHYNDMLQAYTGKIYLKQGYYDYQYAVLRNNAGYADVTTIEGNHMETQNTYYVLAYYRELSLYYDKLVGFTTIHAPSN